MFNDSYHSLMRSNRMLQKNLSAFVDVQIVNSQAYSNVGLAMLQMCDVCSLKKQTKYLIKKSMDTYILKHPISTPNEIQFAAINLFRLAIKYNEDPSKFDEIMIQRCMLMMGPQYMRQDFIDFELQFYNRPEFNMDFTTPYDYLGVHVSVFPMDSKQLKNIRFILDFSFTIPELMFSSAQQIFYGCLLKVFHQNVTQTVWILRQTFSEQKCQRVFRIIYQSYELQVQAASNAQFQ